MRDLFAGPPPNPAQLAAIRAAQEEQEAKKRTVRQTRNAAIQKAEKLQAIVTALGAKLVRNSEDDDLAALFHRTCDQLHAAETAVDEFYESMSRQRAQDRRAV
jgi:hypothetical protein